MKRERKNQKYKELIIQLKDTENKDLENLKRCDKNQKDQG